MPRLFCRPLSDASDLKKPKNTPLLPDEAVIANVPDAVRRSFSVFGSIFRAYVAVVGERQIVPPISPFSAPAMLESRYPKSCATV